ncbi:WD40 repeat domain-containing protein (plasmid) [Streptomyces sp. NBC_01450]|uniref:WD40 repeat domain-containing protein n=1 Tax=Streptomyces sp. NBC_01450 TaxID=2903871 RepID=UPI002E31C8C6|nr:WD40 repeat domain-containing protein [Streptomyces sp. NBC_01450]
MTDLVHDDGTCGEPAATSVAGPGTGWQVEWASGGLISGFITGTTGHADWVRSAATTVVDGRAVAITGADDEAVLVWDLATGKRIGAALPARGSVWTAVTELVDGRTVVLIADPSALVQSWDLAEGRPLASLAGGAAAAATGVVNGRPVVLMGRQNVPRLLMWDPATGEVVGDLVSDPPARRVGAVVAVATAVVDGHTKAVTLHDDSTVGAWNLTERLHQGQVAPPTGGDRQRVSLTAAVVGGRLVAVTGSWDGQVQVWDVAACTEATGREPLTGHTGPVWALATTVIDRRPLVVTGGDDQTVRVWDMAAHRQVGLDLVFPSEVTAVTMASDGRLVVGFGSDLAVLAPHPHAWAGASNSPGAANWC